MPVDLYVHGALLFAASSECVHPPSSYPHLRVHARRGLCKRAMLFIGIFALIAFSLLQGNGSHLEIVVWHTYSHSLQFPRHPSLYHYLRYYHHLTTNIHITITTSITTSITTIMPPDRLTPPTHVAGLFVGNVSFAAVPGLSLEVRA